MLVVTDYYGIEDLNCITVRDKFGDYDKEIVLGAKSEPLTENTPKTVVLPPYHLMRTIYHDRIRRGGRSVGGGVSRAQNSGRCWLFVHQWVLGHLVTYYYGVRYQGPNYS